MARRDGYGVGDMTVGDYANGMPNIRLGEMFRSFGRQLRWVIPLFLVGAVPAWYLTKDMKRTYQGNGIIQVTQGPEHTYQPGGGDGGTAVTLGPESITELEASIMNNNEVIERVIGQMVSKYGESRFNRKAYQKINEATRSGDRLALNNARVDLYKAIEKNFWVRPRAKAGVIDIGFRHEDGEIAVDTLNAFIDEYQAYRRTIFVDGSADVFYKEATSLEEQLDQVEKEIMKFHSRNGITNFDSQADGASKRAEDMRSELNTTRSRMVETEAALAAVEAQLRDTPEVIDIQIEDLGSQRVAQAELELKQLLAKYLPTSNPVRAKQAEIEELKSFQTSNGGEPRGRRRVGPNTTHQALVVRRNTLMATAESLREKEFTVQQMLGTADDKVRQLQVLSPQYNNLLRLRSTLDERLRSVNSKLQAAKVAQEQAEAANSENVHVIAPASLPRKGRNMQKIMFALIMIGWGFTLFMLALLRVFLDPRLYSDPTRRMRPQVQGHASDNWGEAPYQAPAPSYVPEPVPVRPAAAQAVTDSWPEQNTGYYQEGYAQPAPMAAPAEGIRPFEPQPYVPPSYAPTAAPYIAGSAAVAYDQMADPYHNPYSQPVETGPSGTGPLPGSETE